MFSAIAGIIASRDQNSDVAPVPTDPLWPSVKSLLHFDDAPGTTIPTDAVPGVTWQNQPIPYNAVVSDTRSRFGSGSLFRPFSGAGGLFASFPSVVWTASTPFTFEYWVYFNAFVYQGMPAGFSRHFSVSVSGYWSSSIIINVANGKLVLEGLMSGTGTTTLVTNTWYHVAVTSDGTTGRIFLNGNPEITFTPFTPWSANPETFNVGVGRAYGFNGDFYNGFIDEFRWTHGACRYTAPFTPPAEPFLNT